jgi:hypothetical protein
LLGLAALANTLLVVGHPASRAVTSVKILAVDPKEKPILPP